MTGRIGDTESLFWYADGTGTADFQDPGFEPVTELAWASVEEEQQADELCQGDLACLYDLFVTKDTVFATSTLDTGDKNEITETDASRLTFMLSGWVFRKEPRVQTGFGIKKRIPGSKWVKV